MPRPLCLLLLLLTWTCVAPAAFAAETAAADATQDKLEKLQDLVNRIELGAEGNRAALEPGRPAPIRFTQGQLLLQEAVYGPSLSSTSGVQALLGFGLDPAPGVRGAFELELLGAVAEDRLLPQQELTQYYIDKQAVLLKRSEISFEGDGLRVRAFRMVPRPDFYEEGDMFCLLPAVDDPGKPYRQSGRSVPQGMQASVKAGWLKGLDVWAGDELIYGINAPTGFARWRGSWGRAELALMGLWERDAARSQGTLTVHAQEAWLRLPLAAGAQADLALLRRGSFIGQSYTAPRMQGEQVVVDSVSTGEADAWGGILRLRWLQPWPAVEEIKLLGEYAGPLAGNLAQLQGLASFRLQAHTLLSLEALWQKPPVGPGLPPTYYGSPGLNLGLVPGTGPRPYGSIVSVSQDPISGVNNREMTSLGATLEFNPGKGWFYRWRPRIVDAWNFNTELDTPFSSALSLHATNYPTGTDLGSYVDAGGHIVAEPLGASGLYPSQGWLWNISDISAFRAGTGQAWLVLAWGQQFAGLSPSLLSDKVYASEYLSADATLRLGPWLASAGYAENIYGPDDWYRTFGMVIGSVTRASLSYKAGASEVSLRWEAWRDKDPSVYRFGGASVPDPDNPTTLIQTAAPIDQFMLSYALNF